ncbi:unnamed protein product [Polarella glacialis]|uniref:Uncharacterized protein n=1 Tax=Polarella glacialis TaxID=89957 RepID=A0A813DNR1_POLGL|nr:unnamed protein product [Polarella glacialis]
MRLTAEALPGDPVCPPSATTPRHNVPAKSPRHGSLTPRRQRTRAKRKEVWCPLRAPSFGTEQQCYTWGAAVKRNSLLPPGCQLPLGDNSGVRAESVLGGPAWAGSPDPGRPSGAQLLAGDACSSRAALASAAQQLRAGGRGTGTMTATEFEYFCVRQLGLDLAAAREVFDSCQVRRNLASPQDGALGGTVPAALLAEALEDIAGGATGQDGSPEPNHLLEARLELEWRATVGLGAGAAAGELRLFAAELRQRPLPAENRLLGHLNGDSDARLSVGPGVSMARVGPPGRPKSANRSPRHATPEAPFRKGTLFPKGPSESSMLGKGEKEGGSALILRFSLSSSRDVYPDYSEVTPRGMLVTPRLKAPEASWIVPHVVFVSTALVHGTVPATGERYALVPQHSVEGESVPVCTCARLCDAQRAALHLGPQSSALQGSAASGRAAVRPRPPQAGEAYAAQVPRLPLSVAQPTRTGSDTQLRLE